MRKFAGIALLLFMLISGIPVSATWFDFQVTTIEVSTGTAYWGPFAFDFSNALPSGDSLLSATVKSTGPDGSTETTAHLIDGNPTV